MTKKLTPAQQQFHTLKAQHQDAVLFFRMGDFYETFYDDAELCHRVLDITLTSRDRNSENPIPMAGVPHHSAEKYIQKLVQTGHKVAIAEQIGEVTPGKVVEREIVRVETPGTYLEHQQDIHYLLALSYRDSDGSADRYHLAWGDFVMGEYWTQSFSGLDEMLAQVQRIDPVEIVLDTDFPQLGELETFLYKTHMGLITKAAVPHDTDNRLIQQIGTSTLKGYGTALADGRKQTCALLFSYLVTTQKANLQNIHAISYHNEKDVVHVDAVTLKNLEVFTSSYEHNKKQSLFHVINTTRTAMGSRLLQFRLSHPVRNREELYRRLDLIEYYQQQKHITDKLRSLLKGIPDLPRLQSKLLYRSPSAQVMQQLRFALDLLLSEGELVCKQELLRCGLSEDSLNQLVGLYTTLMEAIHEEPIQDSMNYIADGYDKEVDQLRNLAYNSDAMLLAYQKEIADLAGCTVKLKYISNQGYFLEVSARDAEKLESYADLSDVRKDFSRRQTLKTSERYVTTYLLKLQEEIINAKEQLKIKEYALLLDLVSQLHTVDTAFTQLSNTVAEIDLSTSMAWYASVHKWTKPEIVDAYAIEITRGRHPVVEAFLPKHEQFIPNDTELTDSGYFHLITGPNMGGKSTYLRQTALIVLLAHAGLYVPASGATVGLVDGIFARVGSGDALAQHQSTFMTEMLEMANILNNATSNSFVILDELGRGTSTYDGMALAKAIIVYMCQKLSCKTIFATHYHELTALESLINGFVNYSVSAYEKENDVVFLKKVVHGGASKSYGIDVAKLAGVPDSVLEMARQYLSQLEDDGSAHQQVGFNFGAINDSYKKFHDTVSQEFATYDINELTPIEALLKLQSIKKLLD